MLEFVADINGIHVNGIDMIHWNDDDKITSVKVMLRPIMDLKWANCWTSQGGRWRTLAARSRMLFQEHSFHA